MTTLADMCRGLACPQVGLDNAFFEAVIVGHSRRLVGALLDRRRAAIETASMGLTDVLAGWLDQEAAADCVWDIAFGELVQSLKSPERSEVRRSAAAVALRLHEYGAGGEWSLDLDRPARFQFDRWLLPPASRLKVAAGPSEVTVETSRGPDRQAIRFCRTEAGWSTDDGPAFPAIGWRGVRLKACTAECIASEVVADQLLRSEAYPFTEMTVRRELEPFLGACTQALNLIERIAPPYAPWVARVTRGLMPVSFASKVLNSASGLLAPGMIALSNLTDIAALGEMIVHEATHQYFYVTRRLGPIDDGSDDTLHFSPFRNTGRPIMYIVFSYHAFGNVLLFYRNAQRRARPEDQDRIDARVDILQRNLATLEAPIRASAALTPLGAAMWEPLYEELHR